MVALFHWRESIFRSKPFDISEVHASGTLSKGEEIKEFFDDSIYIADKKTSEGLIVLTNKRFLFLQKPSGRHSHGVDLVLSFSWRDVMSVSLSTNKINLTARNGNLTGTYLLRSGKMASKTLMEKIVGNKNSFVDETVIEAKTVIIEEGNKDKASEILQKRLARGEITLDEFHKKIQRT